MPPEAVTSEQAYEDTISAREAWAKSVARQLDSACRTVRDIAVPALVCRGEVAEWETHDR